MYLSPIVAFRFVKWTGLADILVWVVIFAGSAVILYLKSPAQIEKTGIVINADGRRAHKYAVFFPLGIALAGLSSHCGNLAGAFMGVGVLAAILGGIDWIIYTSSFGSLSRALEIKIATEKVDLAP
jgi:hypothetical protein